MKKTVFLNKCSDALAKYFTPEGTKATIEVMNRLKLKDLKDTDDVPKEIIELCKQILYQRVMMLKGSEMADKFSEDMRVV